MFVNASVRYDRTMYVNSFDILPMPNLKSVFNLNIKAYLNHKTLSEQ